MLMLCMSTCYCYVCLAQIAIARKDATIDVVLPPAADAVREDPASPQQAVLLASITHDKMKPGLQRWVGLAVGPE